MAKRKAARGTGRKPTTPRRAGTARKAAGRKRAAAKSAARRSRPTARKKARATAAKRPTPPKRQPGKATRRPSQAASTKTVRKTAKARKAAATQPRRPASPPRSPAARPAARPKAALPKAARPKAAAPRRPPALERERRILDEDIVQTPPSTLDLDRSASAVRSGRRELREKYDEHTETSPALTGGDIDADWESAYSVGDEAPGGDNPTPDQDIVDDIGRAVGIEYQDNEELKGADKVTKRDKNRWELDPASSDDWDERE